MRQTKKPQQTGKKKMSYLLAILKAHEVECLEQDGCLMVVDVWIDAGGRVYREWIKLEPTKSAVAAFLGY